MNKPEKKAGPKILVLDIETSPLITYTWGLFNQMIGTNQIVEDTYVISYAAKWLDEDKIFYRDQRNKKDISDNKELLKEVRDLIDKADILLTHNGKSFDYKRLNAEFVLNKITKPSSVRHLDTLTIVKKHFRFTSNKLAFLTHKLCTKHKKLEHGKYPGMELWKACLDNKLDAWKEMELYNKEDVKSLEEFYHIIKPWDDSINYNVYYHTTEHICKCGSREFKKNGCDYRKSTVVQRYACKKCGSEVTDKKNLLKTLST